MRRTIRFSVTVGADGGVRQTAGSPAGPTVAVSGAGMVIPSLYRGNDQGYDLRRTAARAREREKPPRRRRCGRCCGTRREGRSVRRNPEPDPTPFDNLLDEGRADTGTAALVAGAEPEEPLKDPVVERGARATSGERLLRSPPLYCLPVIRYLMALRNVLLVVALIAATALFAGCLQNQPANSSAVTVAETPPSAITTPPASSRSSIGPPPGPGRMEERRRFPRSTTRTGPSCPEMYTSSPSITTEPCSQTPRSPRASEPTSRT